MRLLQQAAASDQDVSSAGRGGVITLSPLAGQALLDQEGVTWFDANWMFISLACALLAFGWLLLSSHWPGSLGDKLLNPLWWAYLAVPTYSIHQFEEHGYDIYGRRFMFSPVFNAGTGTRLSQKFGVDLQVYPRVVTWVNVVGVSVFFTYWACMARKENGYYPATLAWGLAVINGLGGHILPYFIDQGDLRYVPGAFQSLFMVPMGLWVLLVVFKKEGLLMGTLVPLFFGILWHAIGVNVPVALFTSVPMDIRLPFFLGLASIPPVMLVNTQSFQSMLSHQQRKNKQQL